jgi:hypothetical protein
VIILNSPGQAICEQSNHHQKRDGGEFRLKLNFIDGYASDIPDYQAAAWPW